MYFQGKKLDLHTESDEGMVTDEDEGAESEKKKNNKSRVSVLIFYLIIIFTKQNIVISILFF